MTVYGIDRVRNPVSEYDIFGKIRDRYFGDCSQKGYILKAHRVRGEETTGTTTKIFMCVCFSRVASCVDSTTYQRSFQAFLIKTKVLYNTSPITFIVAIRLTIP